MAKKFKRNYKRDSKYLPEELDAPWIKDPQFRKLQDTWYKKLKEDGFKDLEKQNKSTGKGQDSHYLNSVDPKYLAKLEQNTGGYNYFWLMRRYSYLVKQPTDYLDFIWSRLAEGVSVSQIHRDMKAINMKPNYLVKLYKVVAILKEEMWAHINMNREFYTDDPMNEEQEFIQVITAPQGLGGAMPRIYEDPYED